MGVQAAPRGRHAFNRYKQSDYTGGTQSYMGAQGSVQTDFSDPARGQAPTMTGQTTAPAPANPMANTSTGIKDATQPWNGAPAPTPAVPAPTPQAAPTAPALVDGKLTGLPAQPANQSTNKSGVSPTPPSYNNSGNLTAPSTTPAPPTIPVPVTNAPTGAKSGTMPQRPRYSNAQDYRQDFRTARQGWRNADPATRGNRQAWFKNYFNGAR